MERALLGHCRLASALSVAGHGGCSDTKLSRWWGERRCWGAAGLLAPCLLQDIFCRVSRNLGSLEGGCYTVWD